MAQRAPGKDKRQARPAKPSAAGESPADVLRRLERERDALKAELDAARGQIAELEGKRAMVADRIDWLIDSLGSLLEQRA